MREIQEKFAELTQAYKEQLELYNEIGKVGSQEGDLINQGSLDQLLQVLKAKEKLLKQAGEYEQKIKTVQGQLVQHFGVESFSIPRLKLAAASYYQDALGALEEVLGELVPVLERLENQERQSEAALNKYLERNQPLQAKTVQMKQAGRAYGKK